MDTQFTATGFCAGFRPPCKIGSTAITHTLLICRSNEIETILKTHKSEKVKSDRQKKQTTHNGKINNMISPQAQGAGAGRESSFQLLPIMLASSRQPLGLKEGTTKGKCIPAAPVLDTVV